MRQFDDLLAEQFQSARINASRLVIFVDELFQVPQGPIAFGAGQRRRQMVDDDGGCAPLGLRALARIVDDEGVQVWQRAQRGLGKTFVRQRQRLARQPFQIAVLAHMDDRIGAIFVAQPGMESQVVMRRNQRRIMVRRHRVDIIAACRLQADGGIAAAEGGNSEGAAVGLAGQVEGIALRRAPAFGHRLAHGPGQRGKE